MRVGVPKEIKVHEYRVGLTPGAVREYVAAGHNVVVETDAGGGIGATDEAYRKAGAVVAGTAAEIFKTCDMIVKVKEPQPRECTMMRDGQILFKVAEVFEPAGADASSVPEDAQTRGLGSSSITLRMSAIRKLARGGG